MGGHRSDVLRIMAVTAYDDVLRCYKYLAYFFLGGGGVATFENFLLIWKCRHCRWRPANVDLYTEGSIACKKYCDTKHPFIMIIFEDP